MKKSRRDIFLEKYVFHILFFCIIFLWGYNYFFLGHFFPDIEDRGVIGDSFGVINSLFSGLAFLGIIITIYLQREDLKLQREDLHMTREELKKSAEAQEQQLKLQILINKLSAYTSYVESLKKESNNNIGWNVKNLDDDERYLQKLKNAQKKTLDEIAKLEKQ